jgi:hypothetical protein
MTGRGLDLKFYGPWQMAAGVEEYFLPLQEDITVSNLLRKLDSAFGGGFSTRGEGLICYFGDTGEPIALKMEDKVFPGSTVIFLGIIESG